MSAVTATYVGVDRGKVGAFHVIHHAIRRVALLVIPDIPPLRAHPAGVTAVLIIQETILLRATPAGVVVRQQVPKILHLGVKLF